MPFHENWRRARAGFALLALLTCCLSCTPHAAVAPWQEVPLGTDAAFAGVWFADSANGWIAGGAREVAGGLLGDTHDGGKSWHIRSGVSPDLGPGSQLFGIQFRDRASGCAVADGGQVMLTSDGGESWRRVRSGRSSSDALVGLQMLDDRVGWAIGPASLVGTSDGGEHWSGLVYNRAENGYLSGNAVAFTDENRGWLVGRAGMLMRSDDGGHTWNSVALKFPPGSAPTLWDITFVDATHGWLVGDEGALFHTADGGDSWQRQVEGVPVERVLARGERPRPPDILPGLDGGPSRLDLRAVRFADTQRGFALGNYSDAGESVVLGTRDGGATWRTEHTAAGQYLHALYVLDRRHAWAVGDRARTGPQVLLRYTSVN